MTDRVARLRVRSVRMKKGGASVRVLHRPKYNSLNQMFIANATDIAKSRNRMAGYAIVAWTDEGATSTVCHTNGQPVPRLLAPEFVKTCVLDWLLAPPDDNIGPTIPDSA